MRRLKVVVAEDEALSRKRLVRLLQEAGCVVVNSFAEGPELARTGSSSTAWWTPCSWISRCRGWTA